MGIFRKSREPEKEDIFLSEILLLRKENEALRKGKDAGFIQWFILNTGDLIHYESDGGGIANKIYSVIGEILRKMSSKEEYLGLTVGELIERSDTIRFMIQNYNAEDFLVSINSFDAVDLINLVTRVKNMDNSDNWKKVIPVVLQSNYHKSIKSN